MAPKNWIVVVALLVLLPASALGAELSASSVDEMRDAMQQAESGDVITLAPGTYAIDSKVSIRESNGHASGVTLRAESLGDVTFEIDALEGFLVNSPRWTFENLAFEGVCADDSNCEHAMHIVGLGDETTVRNCEFREFNAHIKGNGTEDGDGGERLWPDQVVIEDSEFFNSAPRETSNPVTPIDVVGGNSWVVRRNFIHDHAKAGGNNVSYAAFLKGNSFSGVFEQNLVACEWLHEGHVRVGLSFGGGGSGPDPICQQGTCTPEHRSGMMRNNIIINCSDVGIYLNEAKNTTVSNNTVINTLGIDARFEATNATITNNLLTGRIKDRDGGTSTRSANVIASMGDVESWFPDPDMADFSTLSAEGVEQLVDAGDDASWVSYDYCGTDRPVGDGKDVGAVEYVDGEACDTTSPPMPEPPDSPDAGDVGEDDFSEWPPDDTYSGPTDPDATGSDIGNDGSDDSPGSAESGGSGCNCTTGGDVPPAGVLMLLIGLGVARLRRR